MKAKRVERPQKADRYSPAAGIIASRIQAAVWDFDRDICEAEKTWGVDRLPYLVSDTTRERWWRAVAALNDAIEAQDDEKVRSMVDNLRRGIARLIEEATAAGQKPLEPETWETPLPGGRVLRIVRTWPEHAAPVDKRPGVVTWSIEEVARVLDNLPALNAVKDTFPGAAVAAVRPSKEDPNDELPF
jgi:hypothetical protein